ncbi:MAG: Nif3-like dinuclear metal center hexameric protein [Lachnospiraceae bacterium]
MTCQDVVDILEDLSPKKYACDWDNVGLLVGRKNRSVKKIVVALDATKEIIEYCGSNHIDMLITHHPMIFSPVKQINENDFIGEKILALAENGICYYAMHTNFDAVGGMAQLAAGPNYMNLTDISPVDVCACDETEGMGRYGKLPTPMTATQVAIYVKEKFDLDFVMLYQSKEQKEKLFDKVAIMPGSGKSELEMVRENGYELYITGDYGHHSGIDALDMGMTVIDATHYGLEHIFIDYMVSYLQMKLGKDIEIIGKDMGCPIRIVD